MANTNNIIDQITVRRGNNQGGITETIYDIGAKASNVKLSNGTSVETAISGTLPTIVNGTLTFMLPQQS